MINDNTYIIDDEPDDNNSMNHEYRHYRCIQLLQSFRLKDIINTSLFPVMNYLNNNELVNELSMEEIDKMIEKCEMNLEDVDNVYNERYEEFKEMNGKRIEEDEEKGRMKFEKNKKMVFRALEMYEKRKKQINSFEKIQPKFNNQNKFIFQINFAEELTPLSTLVRNCFDVFELILEYFTFEDLAKNVMLVSWTFYFFCYERIAIQLNQRIFIKFINNPKLLEKLNKFNIGSIQYYCGKRNMIENIRAHHSGSEVSGEDLNIPIYVNMENENDVNAIISLIHKSTRYLKKIGIWMINPYVDVALDIQFKDSYFKKYSIGKNYVDAEKFLDVKLVYEEHITKVIQSCNQLRVLKCSFIPETAFTHIDNLKHLVTLKCCSLPALGILFELKNLRKIRFDFIESFFMMDAILFEKYCDYFKNNMNLKFLSIHSLTYFEMNVLFSNKRMGEYSYLLGDMDDGEDEDEDEDEEDEERTKQITTFKENSKRVVGVEGNGLFVSFFHKSLSFLLQRLKKLTIVVFDSLLNDDFIKSIIHIEEVKLVFKDVEYSKEQMLLKKYEDFANLFLYNISRIFNLEKSSSKMKKLTLNFLYNNIPKSRRIPHYGFERTLNSGIMKIYNHVLRNLLLMDGLNCLSIKYNASQVNSLFDFLCIPIAYKDICLTMESKIKKLQIINVENPKSDCAKCIQFFIESTNIPEIELIDKGYSIEYCDDLLLSLLNNEYNKELKSLYINRLCEVNDVYNDKELICKVIRHVIQILKNNPEKFESIIIGFDYNNQHSKRCLRCSLLNNTLTHEMINSIDSNINCSFVDLLKLKTPQLELKEEEYAIIEEEYSILKEKLFYLLEHSCINLKSLSIGNIWQHEINKILLRHHNNSQQYYIKRHNMMINK